MQQKYTFTATEVEDNKIKIFHRGEEVAEGSSKKEVEEMFHFSEYIYDDSKCTTPNQVGHWGLIPKH